MTTGWIVLLHPGVMMTEPECDLHRPGGETEEHSRDLPPPGERDNISVVLRRRERRPRDTNHHEMRVLAVRLLANTTT